MSAINGPAPTAELIRGVDEAAAFITQNYFPCTPRYLRELTDTKQIPYFLIAGRRHYSPADVAQFVASRRVASVGGDAA